MIVFLFGFMVPILSFYLGYKHGLTELEYIEKKRAQQEKADWEVAIQQNIEKRMLNETNRRN